MDEESFKKPCRIRWLLAIVIICSMFAFTYYERKSAAQPPTPLPPKAKPNSKKTPADHDPTIFYSPAARYLGNVGSNETSRDRVEVGSSVNPEESPGLGAGEIKTISSHCERKGDLYHPIIARTAKRYGVDPALIKAIIMAESGYNAQAVSEKGASGLMQLMPRTAKALGVKDAFDPEHNVKGGVKYFRQLLDQFNDDVKLALAAYNAGSRKVREHKDVPPIKATQAYVKRVLGYYEYYKKKMKGERDNV